MGFCCCCCSFLKTLATPRGFQDQFPDLGLNLGHDSESTESQPRDNQGTPSKLLFAATWMDLKGIMLSEISQMKTNTIWNHLYVKPKRIQQTNEYARKKKAHRYREETSGYRGVIKLQTKSDGKQNREVPITGCKIGSRMYCTMWRI